MLKENVFCWETIWPESNYFKYLHQIESDKLRLWKEKLKLKCTKSEMKFV